MSTLNPLKEQIVKLIFLAFLHCALAFCTSPLSMAQDRSITGSVQSRIGEIELDKGLPATPEMVQKIYDEMDFQRATQAYIWALPIVAMNEWKRAHEEKFGANSFSTSVGSLFFSRLSNF